MVVLGLNLCTSLEVNTVIRSTFICLNKYLVIVPLSFWQPLPKTEPYLNNS